MLKKNNFNSFFIVNDPYTIIYPKNIGNKKGILFTTNDKKEFPKPLGNNELLPTDNEEIAENKVSYMAYNNNNNNKFGEAEYYIISGSEGDDPVVYNKELTFTLNKYIAILEVSSEDIPIVVVDMNGESYRIRLAKTNADSDVVYKEWRNRNFTKHEKQLLEDINILEMKPNKEDNIYIANFLYYLGFYKCFNDVSLLTNNECMIVRDVLKELYKFNLKRKQKNNLSNKDNNNINVNCVSAGVEKNGKISCEIYKGNNLQGTIDIDKPNRWNGRVTGKMKQQALMNWNESEQQKK